MDYYTEKAGMDMVNLYYFSAAGNSLYAAKQLQEALVLNGRQVRLVSVAAAMQQRDFCPVGEVGFVMPLLCFACVMVYGLSWKRLYHADTRAGED